MNTKRWILTAAVLLLVCGTVHAAFTYSAANFRWNSIKLLEENGDLDNWANEVEDYLDGTSPLPIDDKAVLQQITAPSGNPGADYGWLYVKDNGGTMTLYFEDDQGTVTSCIAGAGTPAGSDTQIQYNNGGAFGAITGFVWDDTNVRVNDDQTFAFGTDANWTVEYDEGVDDQLLFLTANTTCTATTDPMFEIIVGASPTADQQVFGVAKGTQSSNTALFTVDEDGDGVLAGSLTLGSTLYQTSVVAAASGNQNLTIDAAGNGTITLAGTSTGKIVHTTNTELDADVDLGDSTADSVSVNGLVITDVTLDDGTTDSPTFSLKDATNETCALVKKDNGDTEVTIPADTDFEIVTGNLAVGNGSPGTAAMDGEDFYVNGDSEFDGAAYFDGNVTLSGATTTMRTNEAVTVTHAANGSADDFTISQTGNQDASLILSSEGTGSDAIALTCAAGTLDVDANDYTLDVTNDVTATIGGNLTYAVTGNIDMGGSPLTNVYRTVDDTNQVLTASMSGQVCTNQADADNNIWTLPTAAAGLTFTFIDVESGAAADIYIKAAAGDTINGGAAAQYYACKTDSHPQSVTLVAVNATEWYSVEEVGTWVADDTPD